MRVFGDGGANRFFDGLPKWRPNEDPQDLRLRHLPDAICGDLDSIREDVLEFYRSLNVPIRDLSADQDSTDAQKCIAYLREMHPDPATIVLLGASHHLEKCMKGGRSGSLGGRLDHTLSNLHTLHLNPDLNILMIGEGNCVRLLKRGKTKIEVIPEHSPFQG